MTFAKHSKLAKAPAIALAVSLGLVLSGCGGMATNRSLYSTKQPVVERTNYTLDVNTNQAGLPISEQQRLNGQPVEKGWISSHFGQRTDPFTGKPAMHNGMDFAGREGSSIIAVAAGVVTWAGHQSGYGNLVEVSHGDGFVTRYAHNKQNLVEAGAIVRKGDTIALMGSSGRSTGAHVHYEVYKHGRPVDPSSYVRRTRR